MIRQTMEWSTPCGELQCSQCRSRRSAEWREQVLAMAAAVTFLVSGIGVILLNGGLFTAVAVGLISGGCAMLLASKAMNAVEKRRLQMCGDL